MSPPGCVVGAPNLSPTDNRSRFVAYIVFAVALAVGLYLRLIDLAGPPYENHAFRQTQTLSTVEDYYRHGIDLLHPKTIYMGYPGTFVLELPVFQAMAASLYKLFGPQLAIVRLLNILIGTVSAWLLYLIIKAYFDQMVGLFATMIYWLAPLNLIYHRSMLIDPMAVCCGLASFYLLDNLTACIVPQAQRGPGKSKDAWRWLAFGVATILTAMIKALYLWPAVLLLTVRLFNRRFRPDARLGAIIGIFGLSGVCFLAWNRYASSINDASIFTRGVKPTTLLGISALLSPEYYEELVLHRSKRLLGGFGMLFFPLGLWAAWAERSRGEISRRLWLLILIPPTYLAAFSNINFPHDYYQLIIAPFLAIPPAYGLVWLGRRWLTTNSKALVAWRTGLVISGLVLIVSASFTYRYWYHMPKADPLVLRFEKLCAAKFEAHRPAMVFVAREVTVSPPAADIPEFIYAANLWGFGHIVEQVGETHPLFEQFSPGFTNLEYLVFYGMTCPDWVPTNQFKLEVEDDQNRLFAFRRVAAR